MNEKDSISKDRRTRRLHVRFTEAEYKELKDFIDLHTNYKLSEFVRVAIKELKDKMLYPIQSQDFQIPGEILKSLHSIQEQQKLLYETVQNNKANLEIINEKQEIQEKENQDYMEEIENIRKFFHSYKPYIDRKSPVAIGTIIEGTGIEKKTVFFILDKYQEFFQQKGRGYILNE